MTSKMDIKGRVEYVVNLNAALLERSGYSAEAYCRAVLNTMVQTPTIVDCDAESLQAALLSAMNAGLVPDGKEAAIVPFKGKATLNADDRGPSQVGTACDKGLGNPKDGSLRWR